MRIRRFLFIVAAAVRQKQMEIPKTRAADRLSRSEVGRQRAALLEAEIRLQRELAAQSKP